MATATISGRYAFLSRAIEVAANAATLVVAVLLSVFLIRSYVVPRSSTRSAPLIRPADVITVGANLSSRLPGVHWNEADRTIVFVLSTHCHFCTESAPFFRQITQSAGNDVKLIGVLPEPQEEAISYLRGEGVNLNEVRQASLYKLGVKGTPTMLLVSRKGVVMQSWVGKLAADKQNQVLKVIGASQMKKTGGGL